MNRRQFLTAVALSPLLIGTAAAMPYAFEEGVHYKTLPASAQIMAARGSVQEFFFYGCPHCHDMEKPLHDWLATQPKGISFEQIPAVFNNPSWGFMAAVYYALKETGTLEKAHAPLFDAIIKDRIRPKNADDIADLLNKRAGVDKTAFLNAFKGDKVADAVNRAAKLSVQAQLEAVPSFVINGKYVTDLTMVGSHAKLFALIEQLAGK